MKEFDEITGGTVGGGKTQSHRREVDRFAERLTALTNQRCDRCGIGIIQHKSGDPHWHGLDDRLFRCRKCNAVLCSLQVHFTKEPLKNEESGSHQVYPSPEQMMTLCKYPHLKETRYFAVAINKETGEESKHQAHLGVFCGFVDVVEQESGDSGAIHTEAEDQSSPA